MNRKILIKFVLFRRKIQTNIKLKTYLPAAMNCTLVNDPRKGGEVRGKILDPARNVKELQFSRITLKMAGKYLQRMELKVKVKECEIFGVM